MFRWTALAAVLLALCATQAAGARPERAVAPASHGNPSVYLDTPVLDATGGAPEILVTNASNTRAGVIRMEVLIPNRTAGLTANDVVAVFIDADRNVATGVTNEGTDYVLLGYSDNEIQFARWNGTTLERVPNPASLAGSFDGQRQQFEIAAADLSATTGFHFYVYTQLIDNGEAFDASPSPADEVWVYTLGAPHVDRVTPRFAPGQPRAGRVFRVSGVQLALSSGETEAGSSFRCSATLAGKRLRGTGAGACRFAIPRTARGKQLVVTVTVNDNGQPKTARRTFRVRA